MKEPDETPIGDSNGDGFFDGTVFNAQIAVDRACPPDTASPSPATAVATASPAAPGDETPGPAGTGTGTPAATSISSPTSQATSTTRPATPSPTSTATPSSEDGGTDWNSPALIAAYVAAAALATLAVGGLALLGARRRSGGG